MRLGLKLFNLVVVDLFDVDIMCKFQMLILVINLDMFEENFSYLLMIFYVPMVVRKKL